MPRSLLHTFSLVPPASRFRRMHSSHQAGIAARASWLPTRPTGKRTALIILSQADCGDAQDALETLPVRMPNPASSAFSMVRDQLPARHQLLPDTQPSMRDRFSDSGLYGPQRPTFVPAGIFVGRPARNWRPAPSETLILLSLEALTEKAADVKGDLSAMPIVLFRVGNEFEMPVDCAAILFEHAYLAFHAYRPQEGKSLLDILQSNPQAAKSAPTDFSFADSQCPTARALPAHVRQSTDRGLAGSEPCEPQRTDIASVGILVGRLTQNRRPTCTTGLILLGSQALSAEVANVKGYPANTQINGKHSENHLNFKRFLEAMKSRQTLKTMATVRNHTVCGGVCGDERRKLWPV